MEFINPWAILAVAVFAYFATLVFYRLFLDPLARFPGPKLAAISRWYEAYYDVVLGGKYTFKIAQLHKEYGPIIRISPYELHVSDPAFFDTIYRMTGRWDKYSWAVDAFGLRGSTVFASDHHLHKIRRRAIAPFFSKSHVYARQDLLRRKVDKLFQRISSLNGDTVNLGAAMSAFARDVANEFILGKSYNELGLDDFGIGMAIVNQGSGIIWRTTKHCRWFGRLMIAIPTSWMMRMADDNMKAFIHFGKQFKRDTREVLEAVTPSSLLYSDDSDSSSDSVPVDTNMVHYIANSNLPPAEKELDRVIQEVGATLGAAYETTASTLRLVLYHVYSNPDILPRLRRELDDAFPIVLNHRAVPITFRTDDLKQLEKLPYLGAVLTEGMRLSPGNCTRMARVTDKDLFYHEWCIPAGTPVGMTAILLHTDENSYSDPMRFNPDRWLAGSKTDGAEGEARVYAPFSRGTRICLGIHLAWAEMYSVLSALVQGYDFTFPGATATDFEAVSDNFSIGTKEGPNLHAHVTVRRR
ncbi:trichodiene oxygenase [Apiospora arundinis]|uniref:Trichodiene oxygenase n=1 Tax=Apiospora arundinis TaxID=335852 RepID=A0ABR2JCN8_9PEZI